jgi:uncharacterized membrane protein
MSAMEHIAMMQAMEARPNGSADERLLHRFMVLLLLASVLICGFSFSQGNVLAPMFGVINIVVVGKIMRYVIGFNDALDRIEFDGRMVRVIRKARGREAVCEFDPMWVRLTEHSGGNGEVRIFLASHGSVVELARFLSTEQKVRFASELKSWLGAAREALLRKID